ncbi:unnamed protein product [Gongylonema pulchrum]|uniref:DUF4178 domain-containing protein n=1 Tax=Gongylonema pulchrum TaxID=637853 RepID=A0A183ED86_9BILA|nr:unnamed protein product [Gongylonema pulchrum]
MMKTEVEEDSRSRKEGGQVTDNCRFIFYKIGRIQESNNELIRNGSGFFYMDSNTREWEVSELGIDNPKQSVGHTLHQYYEVKNNPEVFSIMYNDEFPYPNNGTWSKSAGHTKGNTSDAQAAFCT